MFGLPTNCNRLAAQANFFVGISRKPCKLLLCDVAVNKRPKPTSVSYSSTYSCTPDWFGINNSRASTAFGAHQPARQYSSRAGLGLDPVKLFSA